jgi:hypothetical protein
VSVVQAVTGSTGNMLDMGLDLVSLKAEDAFSSLDFSMRSTAKIRHSTLGILINDNIMSLLAVHVFNDGYSLHDEVRFAKGTKIRKIIINDCEYLERDSLIKKVK